jgi:hypothetical protein
MPALPTLIENPLDVVGRPYDGVDHVVLYDVHETMLDPGKSDHPLAAMGVVAQTPCDVVANLNLHCRLVEINVAGVMQFKAHHVLHYAMSRSLCHNGKVRRLEAIREVAEDRQRRVIPWSDRGKFCGSATSIQKDSDPSQGHGGPSTAP